MNKYEDPYTKKIRENMKMNLLIAAIITGAALIFAGIKWIVQNL